MIRRHLVVASAATLLPGFLAPAALADNANWSRDFRLQIEINRCADAGIGNGGELVRRSCIRLESESSPRDADPGNSGDHNQAGG